MSLPPRRRALKARGLSAAGPIAGFAASGLFALAVSACETPPVGWQGAGQMQTLPAPQPDSGGAMTFDSGGPQMGGKDSGSDSENDGSGTKVDGGKEAGSPVDATAPKDSSPKDSAPKDAVGPDDAAGTDACTSNCG
jgi:hypothetical protein